MSESTDQEALPAKTFEEIDQPESVKKSLDPDEYGKFLATAGLAEATLKDNDKLNAFLKDKAALHALLHGIGITFDPDYKFGGRLDHKNS